MYTHIINIKLLFAIVEKHKICFKISNNKIT